MAFIKGTPGPDKLIGTPGRDMIHGFGSSDLIHGGDGSDVVDGGVDGVRDRLYGDDGDDFIHFGPADAAHGGWGDDIYFAHGIPRTIYFRQAALSVFDLGDDHLVMDGARVARMVVTDRDVQADGDVQLKVASVYLEAPLTRDGGGQKLLVHFGHGKTREPLTLEHDGTQDGLAHMKMALVDDMLL